MEQLSLSAQAPALMLYGRRKNGKTSSLKYLPHKVNAKLCPLLVDLQGAASSLKLKNVVMYIAAEMQKSAAKNRIPLDFADIDADAVQADPFFALQNWMTAIEEQYPDPQFLLCFDEFERLDEIIQATNRTPLNFLRNTMQHRRRWMLLFSGSHMLNELPDYWSDCLIASHLIRLTYLHESEARDLICHPVPDFPEVFTADAIDSILHWTHCQPYLVQLTCTVVIEQVNQEILETSRLRLITAEDVDASVATVLGRGYGYFHEFWRDLTDEQRHFLLNINGPQLQNEISQSLIDIEVIERSDSGYQFQIPLIKAYVSSQRSR